MKLYDFEWAYEMVKKMIKQEKLWKIKWPFFIMFIKKIIHGWFNCHVKMGIYFQFKLKIKIGIYFQFKLKIKIGIFIEVLNGINLVVQVLFWHEERVESGIWKGENFWLWTTWRWVEFGWIGFGGMKEAWPINGWMWQLSPKYCLMISQFKINLINKFCGWKKKLCIKKYYKLIIHMCMFVSVCVCVCVYCNSLTCIYHPILCKSNVNRVHLPLKLWTVNRHFGSIKVLFSIVIQL